MICNKCKKEIPDESMYCNYCGATQNNTTISLKVYDIYNRFLFTVTIGKERTELDLYQIVKNNLSNRNIDFMRLTTSNNELLGQQCRTIAELNLKDEDVLYLEIEYFRPTPVYRWGGDMRCLYGCPMSKKSLIEAENYTEEDSKVIIK